MRRGEGVFFLVQANISDSYGISMTGRILPKAAAFSSGESWNGARSQNTLATKSSSQPLTQLWDLLFSSILNYRTRAIISRGL